jgi:uncharacterized membrane protein YfhO
MRITADTAEKKLRRNRHCDFCGSRRKTSMKKSFLKNSYFLYTCTFLLLLPFIFLPFISGGKTFVWQLDGLDQHYPALLYYGKLLRGILAGKGFPMVDFSVGMGFDTITTLHYYVIGDPICLLSVFMTAKNAIFFYNFLILLRFYLAGISFILLMKYDKKDGAGVVLGALIYVFSGYSLHACIRHPFFMNPMIYLPLILIGAEQVLKRKKPYLLIAMAFLSAMSNFYFFYALTIITVIYIVFRYFAVYRQKDRNTLIGLLQTGLKTGGYYLLGTALASAIFIPILYAFSRNGRLNVKPLMASGSYLHYEPLYYLKTFQGFFAPGLSPGFWTILSFSAITAVSTAVLIGNKKYRQFQVIYLLAFIGLFIPAFGFFMNGFSYDSNRWCFVISLLTAITFTYTYEKIFTLEKREKLILLAMVAIYGILAFVFPSLPIAKLMFFILLAVMLLVFLLQGKWFRDRRKISSSMIWMLVLFSLIFNGYGIYSRHFKNYAAEFLSKSEVISNSRKGPLVMLKDIHDKSFYRIETYGDKALNESMILGFHDVSGYFSLMDGDITSYLKDLEVLNQRTAYRFHNLDSRTFLDSLACVKYFVSKNAEAVPYGYQLVKKSASGSHSYYLFRNAYALPLGYTYDQYMLRGDYDKLSALEKQNAMMNAVVLDNGTDYAVKANLNTKSGITKLPVKIIPNSKVSIKNNVIEVKEAGAAITLEFAPQPNSETYIRLDNLNINLKKEILYDFKADGDLGVRKKIDVRNAYYNSYFGKKNYLINLGYSANGQGKAVITFPGAMTLNYGSIEVYSVDMSNYEDR